MAALGKLVVRLSAEVTEFTSAMNKAAYVAQSRMDAIARVTKVAAAAMATAMVVAVGAITIQLRKMIDQADEIGKTAQKVGVTTTALQELQYAAELSGVSSEELTASLAKLARQAAEGNKAFSAMSINVRDANGDIKSADRLMGEVADKFASYADGAQKTALAQELFGKSGHQMIAMLNGGAKGLKDAADEAQSFGAILSNSTIVAATKFNDNITRLKTVFTSLVYEIGNSVIPVIQRLTDELLVGIKYSDGFFDALQKFGMMSPWKGIDDYVADIKELNKALSEIPSDDSAAVLGGMSTRSKESIQKEIDLANVRIKYLRELEKRRSPEFANSQNKPAPELDEQGKKAATQFDSYIDGLRRQIDATRNLTAVEQVLKDIQTERLLVTDDQRAQALEYAQILDNIRARIKQETEAQNQLNQLRADAQRLIESNRDPIERFALEINKLDDMLAAMAIDQPLYDKEFERERKKLESFKEAALEQERFEKEQARRQIDSLYSNLLTAEEAIQQSYERRNEAIMASTLIEETERNKLLGRSEMLYQDEQQALRERLLSDLRMKEEQRISERESLFASLQTQEELILASYEKRKAAILASTEITERERQLLQLRLTEETNKELQSLNADYWTQWLESAEKSLADFEKLTADVVENATKRFGSLFEQLIFDTNNLSEAFRNFAEGMLRSIVNALGQMAAQWIAYKAVQSAVGAGGMEAAVAGKIAEAQAQVAMSGLNAYASTAAIPVTGPALAPGAAAAAISATSPMAAAVASAMSASFAGMFDKGGAIPNGRWGIVGEYGPELVRGPAMVTSRADTAAAMSKPMNVRIVNAFDTSVIKDYLGSDAGEQVILNAVRRNGQTIRSLVAA